jgi:thiamine-triphosphatase
MIEVEKKFQPTEEQTRKLTEGLSLLADKKVVDVYYDTPQFDFAKKSIWLRKRDNEWELKAYAEKKSGPHSDSAEEITDEKEIIKYLGYDGFGSVDELANKHLNILAPIVTERKKYIRDGFNIDFDITDFGLVKTDIELMVDSVSEISAANQKIAAFAEKFGLTEVDLSIKPAEYLRLLKPEIYKEIYG